MRFRRTRPTIPLDRDATGRFLPLIIAVMVLLATLLLSGAVLLTHALDRWQGGLEHHATVQILPLDERAQPLPERVEAALAVLRASASVASAEPLSTEAMGALLSPWLGAGEIPDDLPVPALIDVTLAANHQDLAPLAEQMKTIAGATLDDHGAWMGDARKLAAGVSALAYGLSVLIAAASALMLFLLVRAGMAMHRDVVELLHLVGADDDFIAIQFQKHMMGLAVRGAVVGALLSFVSLWAVGYFMPVVLAYLIWPQIVLLAVFVVLFFVVLAATTSRLTAHRLLAELP